MIAVIGKFVFIHQCNIEFRHEFHFIYQEIGQFSVNLSLPLANEPKIGDIFSFRFIWNVKRLKMYDSMHVPLWKNWILRKEKHFLLQVFIWKRRQNEPNTEFYYRIQRILQTLFFGEYCTLKCDVSSQKSSRKYSHVMECINLLFSLSFSRAIPEKL